MIGWLMSRLGAYLWPVAGAIGIGLVLWGGIQTARLKHAQAQTEEVKRACALERANATQAALKQSEENRAKEQAWQARQKEVSDEAERKLTQARADAVIADAAAGKLQQRVAALVAQARAATRDPASTPSSAPATDAIGLLAGVLGRLDQAAGQYAAAADESRAAGEACVAAYDALTR